MKAELLTQVVHRSGTGSHLALMMRQTAAGEIKATGALFSFTCEPSGTTTADFVLRSSSLLVARDVYDVCLTVES